MASSPAVSCLPHSRPVVPPISVCNARECYARVYASLVSEGGVVGAQVYWYIVGTSSVAPVVTRGAITRLLDYPGRLPSFC
jgi:hypothetical protein